MDKKSEMERVAKVFDEYEMSQTATAIRSLATDLYEKRVSVNFETAHRNIQDVFRQEFISVKDTDPSHKKKLHQAFISLAVSATKRDRSLVEKRVKDLEPTMERILNAYRVIGDVGRSLTENPQLTYEQKYYGACFAYIMIVEGVFRELCEYILMLDDVRTGKARTPSQIENLPMYDLVQEIRSKSDISVLTEGYSNHLRNAIAHANFRFINAAKMNFKDIYRGREIDVGGFTLEEFGKNYYLKIDDLYTLISSIWMLGGLVLIHQDCARDKRV